MIKTKWVVGCAAFAALSTTNFDLSAEERVCSDGKRAYFGVCPDDGNNSRPLQPTKITSTEVIRKIFDGTWMPGTCNSSRTKTIYKIKNDQITGEFFEDNRLVFTYIINAETLSTFALPDGKYRISFEQISRNEQSSRANLFKITIEADAQTRRTIDSEQMGVGHLIKEGLVVSTNLPSTVLYKCVKD